MTPPLWQQLQVIWRQLPREADNKLPSIKELSSTVMIPLMTNAWRMRQVDSNFYLVEHMAETVTKGWGGDLTGSNFLTRVAAEERPFLTEIYAKMLAHPCGMRFERIVTRESGARSKVITSGFPFLDKEKLPVLVVGTFEAVKLDGATEHSSELAFEQAMLLDWALLDLGFGIPEITR